MKGHKKAGGKGGSRTFRAQDAVRAEELLDGLDLEKEVLDKSKRRRPRRRGKKKSATATATLDVDEPGGNVEHDNKDVRVVNMSEVEVDEKLNESEEWPHADAFYNECLICCESLSPSYTLSCGHTFCHACTLQNLTTTLLTPKKKNFTGLFCFYRCGCSFLTAGQNCLQPELFKTITKGLELLETSNKLIVKQAEEDGLITDTVRTSYNDDVQKILEFCAQKYSTYQCSSKNCESYIAVRNVCGRDDAGADSRNIEARMGGEENQVSEQQEEWPFYCDSCTIKGGNRLRISVWRPRLSDSPTHPLLLKGTSLFCQRLSEEENILARSSVCDTDTNASAQQSELEVIQAIYPDMIEVIIPAPEQAGDMGVYFTVRTLRKSDVTYKDERTKSTPMKEEERFKYKQAFCISDISRKCDEDSAQQFRNGRRQATLVQLKERLASELELHVWCPTGYPECAAPMVKVVMGGLSLAEMNIHRKNQLHNTLLRVLQPGLLDDNVNPSDHIETSSIYNCVQAFIDWFDDFESHHIAVQAQLHRLYICDKILTLRCPRCSTAILDFDGCFALECDNCKAGFCGWCLRDCGVDAHRHVVKCDASYHPGSFFGPFSDFMRVHNIERQSKVTAYIESGAVEEECRIAVQEAVRGDLVDLQMSAAENEEVHEYLVQDDYNFFYDSDSDY